ncbi:septation protein SepH [Agromyces sp. GXS1127]|uniref:septation protein SepH n=1 Tax=Agromyces sp. GXS1127 TaxID=3424181 RepID=UPI003D31A763
MQELKVIGVESGALIAASDDGARFRIEVDEVLQSRIRQAVPETHTGPKLSPREVQAHIRSGLSAEEVAELTGASVEYIRRFEGPVIAEREHMVTSALAVPTHAEVAEGDEPTSFGTMVRERLAGLGAHGERWASWKDEERGWMVKLEFTADGIDHDARWSFEPRKQALHPQNADATTLSKQGEVRGGMIPRLRAVSSSSPADEASRFDSGAFTFDANDTADDDTAPQPELSLSRSAPAPAPSGSSPSPSATTASSATSASSAAVARAAIKRADEPAPPTGETADLLEALRRRRGEREVGPAAERLTPAPIAPSAPATPAARPASEGSTADGHADADAPTDDDDEVQQRAGAAARALWGGKSGQAASRQKKGRAAMPSWDEIVFGARSDDDLA